MVTKTRRDQYRKLAMGQILYYYGGFMVPNSFLCLKNIFPLFKNGISGNTPFVLEAINRTSNEDVSPRKMSFIPDDYFIGAMKNDPQIKSYIDYLKHNIKLPHFTEEPTFKGYNSKFFMTNISQNNFNMLDGKVIGIKNTKNKPVLIEELFEDNNIQFYSDLYGIYIDQDEILKRHKYEWFVQLSKKQVFEVNNIIVKYMKIAVEPQPPKTTIKSLDDLEYEHLGNPHENVVAI